MGKTMEESGVELSAQMNVGTVLVVGWAALFPVVGLVRLSILGGGEVWFLPPVSAAVAALALLSGAVCSRFQPARRAAMAALRLMMRPAARCAAGLASAACGLALTLVPILWVAMCLYAVALVLALPLVAHAAMWIQRQPLDRMALSLHGSLAVCALSLPFGSVIASLLGAALGNMSFAFGVTFVVLSLEMAIAGLVGLAEARALCGRSGGGEQAVCSDIPACAEEGPAEGDAVTVAGGAAMAVDDAGSLADGAPLLAAVETVLRAMPYLAGVVAFLCGFFLSVYWFKVRAAFDALVLTVCVVVLAFNLISVAVLRLSRKETLVKRVGIARLLGPASVSSPLAVVGLAYLVFLQGAASYWCVGLLLAANSMLVASVLAIPLGSASPARVAWRAMAGSAGAFAALLLGVWVRRQLGLDAAYVSVVAVAALALLLVICVFVAVLALRGFMLAACSARGAEAKAAAVDSPHDAHATLHQARLAFLQQFGLTERELSIALEFLDGKTMAATADELGISMSTVRYNMSRIYAKTGVSKKAELQAKANEALAIESVGK